MFNLNRSCGVLSRAVPMLSQRYPHDPFKYEIDRFFPHYLFENRVSDPHFCYYCSELRSIRFPHCCCCCYRFLLDYLRWWHVEIYQPWRMCTMLITGTRHVAELSIIPHHVFSLGCANRCLETPRPFQTYRWASLNRLFIDGYERCKCVQLASSSRLNHSEHHLNGSVARPAKSTPIQSRFVDDDFSSTKRLIYLDAATFTANLNAIESGVAVSRGAEMRWNGPSVANVASTGAAF